jgi:hypothetical protein
MAEDNPIEGLDPNKSAFEPMLDMMNQDIPENLSRTTTTTTLYISGDQTQIDQPQETVKEEDPIKTAVDNFRLYQQQEGMSANVGDVNKLFPNATAEQRRQVVESYPELFKEDRFYNQSAEKKYQEELDSGKSSLEILDSLVEEDFGSRVGLMKRFPDLFSETVIQADQQKKIEDEKLIAQDQEKQKKIDDLKIDYDNAKDFDQKRRIQEQIIELEGQPDVFGRRAKIDREPVIPRDITEEDKELIFRDINPDYVTPIIKDQSEKDFFDLNNQIVSIQGGESIPEEEYISVYKKGEYDPEKHKKYDEILSRSVLGLISTDMPADIHKSFFDRNGIAKSEILLRNKLILENTPGLDRSKIYTDEEIAELEAAANQRLLEKTGDVEFEEQKIILGENIRPRDLYNDRLIDSKNTVSKLNTAVVVGDEDATIQNLQELFPKSSGTQFRFSKSDLDGKDAVTIRNFFLGEMTNSMEINLDKENEPIRKIRRFMSESLIDAYIQKDMFDLSQGEGKYVTKDGKIKEFELALFKTLHPKKFGSVDEYSTDDFLGPTYEKSPFMVDPAEIRRMISYIQAERESMPAFGLGSSKKIVPQETIDLLENQIQIAAAVHAEKLKQKGGGLAGAVKYGYISGAAGVYEFIEDRMTDAKFLFGSYGISDDRKRELKSKGLTEDQIYDIEKRYVKDKTESAINKTLSTFSKESQESISESGLVNQVLMNTISSLVTMSGGAGAKLGVQAAFALTSQARLENELKDTNLTDLEKFALTMPMAVLEGVFEEFGMQSALKPGLSSAKKAILMRAIKDLPKDASAKTLNQSIKRVINELAGGTGQKITKAMVSEALTEATQQGAEIVEKNIYNAIADKELFKDVPDVTTVEGFTRATEEVMEAAKMGALSGGLIQGMSQVSNYTVNGFKNAKDVDFEQTYQSLTDDVYRELLMDQIDVKVLAGELSEQDAENIKSNFNQAYPIMREIPAELSSDQKQQSYDLLLERKALEEQVKDKDKNLVVKQTERISEINNQLQQISKTDAVQEQETKEEVLPDEQSEMGLQDVGQRDTQGEEAAEVQQEEEVVDEAATKEYVNELEETKQSDPEQYWTVSSVSLEDAKKGTVVSVEGGKGVVGPDGDIKGVFKSKGSNAENVADKILEEAVKKGGTKLDNFDNYLTRIYKRNGFRVVSRTPFNEEFAPDGWSKEKHGTPDVVAMVYDPESKIDLQEKTFDNPETGYDDMIAYRDSFIKAPVAETVVEEEVIEDLTPQAAENIKNIEKQIDNAKISISSVLPGVEIVTHSTEDSYRKATDEADSKKQASRGEYNPKTNKIHINISKANNRTVAHEVFHAVLLDKVKTDSAAKDLTNRMVKSLSKNLEGMPEVKEALDVFAANYDENIQSEEKLAELVGILAGNYAQMNKPSQSLIKRFLDRLAKMFGLKTFTDGEVVDLLNTIAGKVAVGEEIEFGDINIIGLNGDIEAKGKPRKSLIGSIELKRFPVNSNTKVKENIPMSRFNGKVSNLFESDRMTGAFIEDEKGNPLFSFYGGLMYPSITGKWWASRLLSKAKSIAKNANKNRDKDGYIYGTPIIMNPGSHMSNQDMFEAVWSTMKHDLKDKKSKVTKERFYNMIMKALSLKFTSDIDINISKNESIDSMISKLNKLFESKDLSFEKRKKIIKSLLGDPKKVSDRNFPSAGSILEIAEKFEEPLTKKSETLWDIVVVMRTKGNLEAKVTPETDEFYHNSYPAEISSDAPIEMFILDGAYNITEVFPTLKKSDGQTISWQDYSERHGKRSEKNARSQYGRTSKLSYASGEITTPAKRKQKDVGPVEPRIDIRNLKKKSDKKVKETNKGKGPILRRLRRSLFDRQNDIKRVIKDFVPNPKKVSKIINAIVTKAGASGYANEIFTQQDEKIFKKKNRLGKMVNLSAEEMTNLEAIIYARRIVAINENRRERGMNPYTGMDGLTEQDAIDNLNMMESLVGKKEFDSLSERAEDYFEAFKNNLKMLRDSGRITEETYNNLKDVEYSPIKTLKYIIPQDTMTDEDINNAVSTLGVNKKDIMKLSDMNENEILFDARFLLMMNTNIVVRRSFENKMLNEFSQGYESIDKAGKEALSDFIIEGPVKKVPPGFRKVEYFQDGVKKDLIMREDYARQLLDIKNQNNFLKGLGKMTGANILRFFATGGNPLFIVGNTAVDFANIAFFSDVYSAIKPLATVQLAYDFVKNFLRKTGSTNNYNKIKMEFMEHGGAMDFLSTDGLRMVHDMRIKNRILNKAQKVLAAYARFMSYVGETGEMSFRLAVYERVKKAEIKKFEKENDRSPNQQEMEDIMFEAAVQSRETIDFSQGGTWVKQMDQALPYFNAAMQGLRRPLDYARKNPVGFTSNVVQYAMMAAGMTATSLGTLLRAIGDDEEEKKKVQDMLDSISMYEKANYHIIFTGNKDKDGNYEYVRIKKLPLISILGTATEQYTTKYFLKYKGIDYEIDDRSIKKSIEMSAPLDVLGPVVGDESVGQALGGIVKRNPLAAAWLTYTYNEDTFTGDKVFYEPKDKKIKPYAEGLYDDRVNDIYKVVAPALDMSPKRAQAAVEKIVTSESTNPSISIFYALTNGLFNTEADAFKENSDTFDNGMGHFLDVVSKKMVRHTNPNLLRYKNQDRLEDLEKSIDTDAYLTKIKIKKDINKNVDSEVLRNGNYGSKEYREELKKLEDILDNNNVDTKDRPYYGSYTVRKDLKGQEMFKEMTNIIYERSPKMMAARLYSRYGDSLDDQELKELSQSFKLAKVGNKILKEGYQIYYKKNYLDKSQEEIDKFEKTFGKIR